MKFSSKILSYSDSTSNVDNKNWWENNPMTYDWENNLGELKLNQDYFRSIDEIFGTGHSLCNNPNWPNGYILENFIPYNDVKGKKVLEIGCGAGLVSSHLAKAGAELTSVDLTNQAIKITKARFELDGLSADIQQMDAENLSFQDNTFDFIISWGVIHHSGNMQAILNQIHRTLKPGGKAYIMIYNKNSLRYQIFCRIWLGIFRLKFLTMTLEDIAGSITDGDIARHLNEADFLKMSQPFKATTFKYSDEVDATMNYALGPFRRIFLLIPFLKLPFERFVAKKWGWYMEATLTK